MSSFPPSLRLLCFRLFLCCLSLFFPLSSFVLFFLFYLLFCVISLFLHPLHDSHFLFLPPKFSNQSSLLFQSFPFISFSFTLLYTVPLFIICFTLFTSLFLNRHSHSYYLIYLYSYRTFRVCSHQEPKHDVSFLVWFGSFSHFIFQHLTTQMRAKIDQQLDKTADWGGVIRYIRKLNNDGAPACSTCCAHDLRASNCNQKKGVLSEDFDAELIS